MQAKQGLVVVLVAAFTTVLFVAFIAPSLFRRDDLMAKIDLSDGRVQSLLAEVQSLRAALSHSANVGEGRGTSPSAKTGASGAHGGSSVATAPCSSKGLDHLAATFQTALKTFKDLRVIRINAPHPFSMFVAPDEEKLSNDLVANRFFAQNETVLFHNILQDCRTDPSAPPKLVLDAGANLGYFCLFAASYGCRVVCVEPQQHVRSLLELSVAINGFSERVKVSPNFLAEKIGEGAFMSEGYASGLNAVTSSPTGKPVSSTTIDELVQEDLLLLKMDLEGYERHALVGAEKLFRTHGVENLIVEIKPDRAPVLDWIWAHMAGASACHYSEAYMVPEIRSYELRSIGAAMMRQGQNVVDYEDVWFTRNDRLFRQLTA